MNLPLYIGRRYLFARKSRNVINVISAISVGGIAVGVAALIIIMSVYNGFEDLVDRSLGAIDPDIRITSTGGRTFSPDSIPGIDAIYADSDIESISKTLEENVFIVYGATQTIALARGVDRNYEESTFPLLSFTGKPQLDLGHTGRIGVARGVADRLGGVYLDSSEPIELWFPSRHRRISPSSPIESLNSISMRPGFVFTAGSEFDDKLILLPIDNLRELLEYEDEVTALEIRVKDGSVPAEVIPRLQSSLCEGFEVKDRIGQNEALFRMMKYEKLAIFLILMAVVIIVAFSIVGCLSMLIIEKQEDIATLRFLGARGTMIRRIFVIEGWMISLLGLAIGFVTGLAAVLLQQHFGLIYMPGSLSLTPYPVVVEALDIILIVSGVALGGYLIALLASGQIKRGLYR